MPDNGQKQHYISGFLIRQWAEDGQIGIVCTYHRDSAVVSAKAKTLHSVVDLWSQDLEDSWNETESDAKVAIGCITESLGRSGDNYAAAEAVLSKSKHFDSLIELAVLHHARSLAVPIQRFVDLRTGSGKAEAAEDAIGTRRGSAQGYYDCGLVVSVLPASNSAALGASPVFHTPSLGGPRRGESALFMMPVAPHLVVAGNPEMERGRVVVAGDSVESEQRITWQLMAEPGLMPTPYLICKPSALEQTAEAALAFTEGNPMHWLALYDRMGIYRNNAATGDFEANLATWQPLMRDQRNRQGWHDDPLTTTSMRRKHRKAMAANARTIQKDLDNLAVTVCDCKGHRDKIADPDHAALWEHIMPQVVCQHIRQKRNAATQLL